MVLQVNQEPKEIRNGNMKALRKPRTIGHMHLGFKRLLMYISQTFTARPGLEAQLTVLAVQLTQSLILGPTWRRKNQLLHSYPLPHTCTHTLTYNK